MQASTSFASLILALCFTATFAYPPPDGCTGACATACVNNFTSCVSTCNGDFYCNMMTCLKPRTYPVDQCFWPLMIYTALASGNMYTDVALGPSQCTGNCASNCVNYWNSCIASCNGNFYCNFMTCLKYYSQGTSQCFWPIMIYTGYANPSVQ
uniref:Uncharacterized protein n=1 Tax=Acrobeloides nanus TaxID=290746 RepID=A0A914DAE3_9BILA